jgi:hypothetical protein
VLYKCLSVCLSVRLATVRRVSVTEVKQYTCTWPLLGEEVTYKILVSKQNNEIGDLHSTCSVVSAVKRRKLQWNKHVACVGKEMN